MEHSQNGDVFHAALSFSKVGVDLENRALLREVAETVVTYFELTIVDAYWHRYQPIGHTGVYVLEQSSLTLHTWSEFKKLVIDITTCGKQVDIEAISRFLQELLQSADVKVSREIL